MRFEIFGEKEKIKPFLDEFINLAEEEYDVQIKKYRSIPMPFGIRVPPLPPLQLGYNEQEKSIIFWNTSSMPRLFNPIKGRIVKKMEENLKGFFKAKGLDVEIKYLGD